MPNFYFLVRFLAHRDNIVRSRIANFFLDHKFKDEVIPTMIIQGVSHFGLVENLPSLRLLPYQYLTSEQLAFFLAQREGLFDLKKSSTVLEEYDDILKKILTTRSYHIIKPFIEELPPHLLKAIYLKKWKQTIHRDLFKVYNSYPYSQALSQIQDFISKYKLKPLKQAYLDEIRIRLEVLYLNLTEGEGKDQKKTLIKSIESYLNHLTQTNLVQSVRKKVYPLEAYFYLLSIGIVDWKISAKHLRGILSLFTLDCDPIVYKEALNCLVEFDEENVLSASQKILFSHKITDKAFPYFLKLFLFNEDLEDDKFYVKKEKILLTSLSNEKNYAHRIQICLALSDLFSSKFISQGITLLKKSHFSFISNNNKLKLLLQERLLVQSLITGEKVEGLERFANSYIEKKTSLANRLNSSFFFKKNKNE